MSIKSSFGFVFFPSANASRQHSEKQARSYFDQAFFCIGGNYNFAKTNPNLSIAYKPKKG